VEKLRAKSLSIRHRDRKAVSDAVIDPNLQYRRSKIKIALVIAIAWLTVSSIFLWLNYRLHRYRIISDDYGRAPEATLGMESRERATVLFRDDWY
jgi:hypothetical protein